MNNKFLTLSLLLVCTSLDTKVDKRIINYELKDENR
jgi:hypothetical protein